MSDASDSESDALRMRSVLGWNADDSEGDDVVPSPPGSPGPGSGGMSLTLTRNTPAGTAKPEPKKPATIMRSPPYFRARTTPDQTPNKFGSSKSPTVVDPSTVAYRAVLPLNQPFGSGGEDLEVPSLFFTMAGHHARLFPRVISTTTINTTHHHCTTCTSDVCCPVIAGVHHAKHGHSIMENDVWYAYTHERESA